MLNLLVRKNRRLFESMAHSWIEEGAAAFQITSDGDQPLAAWQSDRPAGEQAASDSVMTAAIEIGQQCLGALTVIGLHGPANQARLDHDAQLLRKWFTLEKEMNSLTTELIQYQDQILMLYELSQHSRHHLEFEPIVKTYLATGRQLLQVEQLILVYGAVGESDTHKERSLDQFHLYCEGGPIELTSPRRRLLLALHLGQKEQLLQNPIDGETADGWEHIMALPVQGQMKHNATLVAINRPLGPFDTPSQKMGVALVDMLGSELERLALHQQILNQTRLETEALMARTVQMTLLPRRAPAICGLDIFGTSEPANQVGGDYYDFIKLSDQELFFSLADVSGKGMPAALSMTNLRSAMRTAVRLMPKFNIQNALHQTNESLYDDFADVEMFATIFCGYFNRVDQTIRYSNGGHAPVIFCPAREPARLLRANGPALGILPNAPIGYGEIPFRPGDLLIAATDGFNESENGEGEMFGYQRLLTLIEQLSHYPAGMMARILNEEVLNFRGDVPQQDDQTIVVLKGTNS